MIDPEKGARAEKVFRSHEENRKELAYALKMLQQPLFILDLKRRAEEQLHHSSTLGAPDQVAIRLHSMKIGREQLLDELWELTEPLEPNVPVVDQPSYDKDNELT